MALHAEDAQQLLRPLPGDMLLPCETGEVQYAPCQAIPHGIVHSHHQVFRHGQVAEQTDILKGPGDAGLIHLGCGHAVGVLAVQHNGARCGLVHLCQQVEYSGFSRPVGADESGDLRAADGQVEILHRLQTAEGHAQPHAFQHRGLVNVPLRQQNGGLAVYQLCFRFHRVAHSFLLGVSFRRTEPKKRFIVGLLVACITRISTMAYTSIR